MSGRVLVEFHPEEAEALLKRVSDGSMSAAECDAAQAGAERLEQALRVERASGGHLAHQSEMRHRAEALIGLPVTVFSTQGKKIGTLDRIIESTALCVRQGGLVSRVNLDLVTGIYPAEESALREAA